MYDSSHLGTFSPELALKCIMAKLKLRERELRELGYPKGRLLGLALQQAHTHYRRADKDWVLRQLAQVLEDPEPFLDDEVLKPLAKHIQEERIQRAASQEAEQ